MNEKESQFFRLCITYESLVIIEFQLDKFYNYIVGALQVKTDLRGIPNDALEDR